MTKTLNVQTLCYIIFSIGIVSSVALIIGAIVGVAYLLNRAMIALVDISRNISLLYHHADSFVQLLILCLLAFIAIKAICFAVRNVRKEITAW